MLAMRNRVSVSFIVIFVLNNLRANLFYYFYYSFLLLLGVDVSDLLWLSESVPQAVLLTVQSKWTPIITSAIENNQMIDSARYCTVRMHTHTHTCTATNTMQ